MEERTTIPLEKETRKKLSIEKELRESESYSDLIDEFVEEHGFMQNRSER
jgi:hypothetical protein